MVARAHAAGEGGEKGTCAVPRGPSLDGARRDAPDRRTGEDHTTHSTDAPALVDALRARGKGVKHDCGAGPKPPPSKRKRSTTSVGTAKAPGAWSHGTFRIQAAEEGGRGKGEASRGRGHQEGASGGGEAGEGGGEACGRRHQAGHRRRRYAAPLAVRYGTGMRGRDY